MRVKMTVAALALAAVAALLPASALGRTITVSPGESIQAAIDDARRGATIKLEPGTYQESVLIEKDGIAIKGAGRKKTKIVPPASPTVGTGCVFEDEGHTTVNGICALNLDEQGNPAGEVEDVSISRLSVTGFNGIGILFIGAEGQVVKHVFAADNGEYGIAAFESSRGLYAHNVTPRNGEAGIYVGDSPNAKSLIVKNVSYDQNIGVFVRDASNGAVIKNKTFGNCAGIVFLNTPGGPDVQHWVAKRNGVVANNRVCAANPEEQEPGVSGIGIISFGGSNLLIAGNGVFGNRAGGETLATGGVVLLESSHTKVAFNRAHGNQTDLLWDGTGDGNRFVGNDCETSQPDGLCEDPEDGDHDDGHHGDHGDHDRGDRGDRGHGDRGKGRGHRAKHKHQRKHKGKHRSNNRKHKSKHGRKHGRKHRSRH